MTLIAYVYFSGQTSGHVRFVEENAAVELAAKMKEKLAESEKLKVKEADISFRVLEGQEETDHLDHAVTVMKMRKDKFRGHKRHRGVRQRSRQKLTRPGTISS